MPEATPTSSAKPKSWRVSPPKSISAAIGINVEKLVTSDRVRTSDIERLTTWEKVARGMRGAFSRIRSNTMIVS